MPNFVKLASGRTFVKTGFAELCSAVDQVFSMAESNPNARVDMREARDAFYKQAAVVEASTKNAPEQTQDFPTPEGGAFSIEPS